MNKTSRRKFLMCSLLGGQAAFLAGCGGGEEGSSSVQAANPMTEKAQAETLSQALGAVRPVMRPPSRPPAPPVANWPPQQSLALAVGSTGTVDLKSLLPVALVRGGRFELDATSVALPRGVALSADGVLSASLESLAGITYGLVFAYIEP